MNTKTIWKTVHITTTSPSKIIKKLEARDDYVSPYAKKISEKIKPKKETVDLVMVKLSEWFDTNPTTTEIYARAKKEGLELCTPATGLQLRLDYIDQPNSDYFWVGMEPIAGSDGYPRVFSVGRDDGGGRWLNAFWTNPSRAWDLDDRIVFRLRKETLNSDTVKLSDGHFDPLSLESRIKRLERIIENITNADKE